MSSDQIAHKNLGWRISIADWGMWIGDWQIAHKKRHLVPEEQDAHDKRVITN